MVAWLIYASFDWMGPNHPFATDCTHATSPISVSDGEMAVSAKTHHGNNSLIVFSWSTSNQRGIGIAHRGYFVSWTYIFDWWNSSVEDQDRPKSIDPDH
jgi:hypothetical protein